MRMGALIQAFGITGVKSRVAKSGHVQGSLSKAVSLACRIRTGTVKGEGKDTRGQAAEGLVC